MKELGGAALRSIVRTLRHPVLNLRAAGGTNGRDVDSLSALDAENALKLFAAFRRKSYEQAEPLLRDCGLTARVWPDAQ